MRTVYVLANKSENKGKEPAKPKPVQIKVGINDGIMTEAVEGIEEGAQVITGILTTDTAASHPAANPFSGGGRRF